MPKRTCPVCSRVFHYQSVAEHKTFPFCSERCRLIDLGAWFAGEHQIVEEMRPSQMDEALHEMIDAAQHQDGAAASTESGYDFPAEGYHGYDSDEESGDEYEDKPSP